MLKELVVHSVLLGNSDTIHALIGGTALALATCLQGNAGIDLGIDQLDGLDGILSGLVGASVAVGEHSRDALVGALADGLEGGACVHQVHCGLDVELGHARLLEDRVLVVLALLVGAAQGVASVNQLLRGLVNIADNFRRLVGGNDATLMGFLVGDIQDACELLFLCVNTLWTCLTTRLHLLHCLLQLLLRFDDNFLVLMDQSFGGRLAQLNHKVDHTLQLCLKRGRRAQWLGVAQAQDQAESQDYNVCGGVLHFPQLFCGFQFRLDSPYL